MFLFEKDSRSYLTEKRKTVQTGKSHKRIFEKIQNSFLIAEIQIYGFRVVESVQCSIAAVAESCFRGYVYPLPLCFVVVFMMFLLWLLFDDIVASVIRGVFEGLDGHRACSTS